MAASDSTCFPVRGQAYRVAVKIVSSSTANPLTGGLTGLSAEVSKDGGPFAAASSVAEIGTSGYVVVDLSSTEMEADSILLRVWASNANAVEASLEIKPVSLAEPTGHWLSQSVRRLEQCFIQSGSYLLNKMARNKTSGTLTLYKRDGATVAGSATYADAGDSEIKGGLE